MAEGLVRYLAGARVDIESAGRVEAAVDPYTQWAMNEAGADIAALVVDPLECKDLEAYTHVVTLSNASKSALRTIPDGVKVSHWDIPDPSQVKGRPVEVIAAYKAIRNQIERRVKALVGEALNA